MDNKVISSWVRQARYRAKRHNIHSDLEIQDVLAIIAETGSKCTYCQRNESDTLDHPFPLKDHILNTPANVVPVCKECKRVKKNNDLLWLFSSKTITEARYLELLSQLFSRKGGDIIKEHVRKLSGYNK